MSRHVLMLRAAVAAVALATEYAASAQPAPRTEFNGWLCELDLTVFDQTGQSSGSVFTFDSKKICTGSRPSQIIMIDCRATIPGWSRGSVQRNNVPCLINVDQCVASGSPGFVPASDSSLKVNARGRAQLSCALRR